MADSTVSAAKRYRKMTLDREPYLERARQCAKVTIPTLVPPDNANNSTKYPSPWQGTGARGVNNLAAALTLTLLPPNTTAMRLVLDDTAIYESMGRAGQSVAQFAEIRQEIDATLAGIERSVTQEIEAKQVRVAAFETFKQLITAGNVANYIDPDGYCRVYYLGQYVISRHANGRMAVLIVHEQIPVSDLTDDDLESLGRTEEGREALGKIDKGEISELDVYTTVQDKKGSPGRYETWQDICGVELEGSRGSYAHDECPWIVSRMVRVDGESYGRSYVEEYIGDLKSLEALSKAVVEASAAAAKVIFLVRSSGNTSKRDLARAESGAFITGEEDDVSTLRLDKAADLSVAANTAEKLREQLHFSFLLSESLIRNAERVTAEEVRFVIQAVERQLGGVYSLLSQEWQLPLFRRILVQMRRANRIPPYPKKFIRPTIITGVDALGRGQDAGRLKMFLMDMSAVVGPERLEEYVNVEEAGKRLANGYSVEPKGLLWTAAERQKRQQAAQNQNLMNTATPAVVDAAAKAAIEGAKNQGAARAAPAAGRSAQRGRR